MSLVIRPVSDLKNKLSDIEKSVNAGTPVFLTKNGRGTMVVMSIEDYSKLTDPIENALDEADYQAETTEKRLTHEEVFGSVKKSLHG